MALLITEEQKMLKDAAAEFLAAKAPVSAMRALRDEGYKTFNPNLWEEMIAMGWTALTVPERYGGLDFGFVGLGQILEETGKHLSKSPLLSSVLLGTSALKLSDNDALKAKFFPGVMEGSIQLTLALEEGKHHQINSFETQAVKVGDDYVLNGVKTMVMEGTTASHFVVVSVLASEISLFLVDKKSEGISISESILMDAGTYAEIAFEKVKVSAQNKLNLQQDGKLMLDQLMAIAYSGLASELLGIGQQAFDSTIQYLKERSQFGVVIGSYRKKPETWQMLLSSY